MINVVKSTINKIEQKVQLPTRDALILLSGIGADNAA